METDVAPTVFHSNLEVPPAAILLGLAEKLSMAGTPGGGLTITVACEVADPYRLAAVSV